MLNSFTSALPTAMKYRGDNNNEEASSYSTSLDSISNDSFYTPTTSAFITTPAFDSRASSIRGLLPSISCKSNFSIQTFHTAAAVNSDTSEEQRCNIPSITTSKFSACDKFRNAENIAIETTDNVSSHNAVTLRKVNPCHHPSSNMLSCASSTSKSMDEIPTAEKFFHGTTSTTATTTATAIPADDQHIITQTNNPDFFIHPIALIQSNRSNSAPNNYFYYGSLDSHNICLQSPATNYSNYLYDGLSEEYEVVLDDGTRQKRSVSLSTMPNTPMFDFCNNNKRKYKANVNFSYFNLGNETATGKEAEIRRDHQRQSSTTTTESQEKNYQNYYFLNDNEEQALLFPPGSSSSNPHLTVRDLGSSSDVDDSDDTDNDMDALLYNRKLLKRNRRRRTKTNRCCSIFLRNPVKTFYHWLTEKVLTYKRRMVLKCSIAYLLGSAFTFIPLFQNMLSPSARLLSQIIATVTVFFSASKTVGGMVEAVLYGLAFTIFASLVSMLSMLLAVYLRSQNHYVISSCITLAFWLAGSTFLWSFLKAHYNKPALATGCGLGSMIMFPVLVKEGSEIPEVFDSTYIEEMFALVTIGTGISAFVCWFIWPVTATSKLRSDINDTLAAVRILLKLLTKTFLLDKDLPDFKANDNLQNAINSHRTSFTSLKSSLNDAKKEYYNFDIWTHADEYDDIVNSLQRLTLHIGGLRSSCGLQFDVMKNSNSGNSAIKTKTSTTKYGSTSNGQQQQVMNDADTFNITTANETTASKNKNQIYHIVKATDHRKKLEYELKKEQTLSAMSIASPTYGNITPSHYFNEHQQLPLLERIPINGILSSTYEFPEEGIESIVEEGPLVQFIKTVRGPMKSLAFTCKQTIVHLQARFTRQNTAATPSFSLMRQTLAMAMSLFEESQQLALTRMYRRKMMSKSKNDEQDQQKGEQSNATSTNTINPREIQSHLMTQFPAEDVFLVYFFVFNLLEFAKELMCLVECAQNLFEDDELNDRGYIHRIIRNYLFTPFWIVCCCFYGRQPLSSQQPRQSEGDDDKSSTLPTGVGVSLSTQDFRSINRKVSVDSFIPNNNNTFNTLHTPKPRTKMRQVLLNLWGFFSWFRQHTVRYGLKSAFVVVLISSLAFIPPTREYFSTWKMDWTLITVMAVMTPTVGGTNEVAVLRVFATILGSLIAVLIYTFLPHQGPLLLFMSWAFSVPCFWLIQNHKHGRFGLFALLAYNLIVPFMYNHRSEELPYDVQTLAFMRCATVSAGVIIGLIVTAYIWPFEARKELRKGLSDFLIRLSWLYKQLVSEYAEDNSHLVSTSISIQSKRTTNEVKNIQYSELVRQAIGKNDTEPRSDSSSCSMPTESKRLFTSRQELEVLARHKIVRSLQFQHLELSLQVSLVELQGLLAYAPNEPRLKGPFPVKTYQAMLTSCQNILDKLLSIRIVVLKDVWATQVRHDLMAPVRRELMEMAGCVLLYFYLLASALQLKTPLPPYLPPAEKARESLMMKLQQLPKITADVNKVSCSDSNCTNNVRSSNGSDDCYMVYYAYVIMMESIIIELDELGKRMKELFGTLIPDEQWAKYFGTADV
ncbi:hypothetical protein BDF20DRAFT_876954 [Mycotypha africana]|uniref:uncharacterized protein n=1 Tax=Mycotypha africana TaxID=64632 RepID=UPI0023008E99|nr:uncharacterized protein BDF20DRAFT_876954 [Mycotypha africana]KAI8975119.1 hypothetical protein BDF20DRAFT_876954 [Mycotypha africana]